MFFIDIVETNTNDENPRQSSLMYDGNTQGEGLEVLGVLPHCYEWKPRTASDRDRLTAYLCRLEYDGALPMGAAMAVMVHALDHASPDEIKTARAHARGMADSYTTRIGPRAIWRRLASFIHACRH